MVHADISTTHPLDLHKQVIFHIVDSVGTSKFSVLNLTQSTDWSNLLVTIINRSNITSVKLNDSASFLDTWFERDTFTISCYI